MHVAQVQRRTWDVDEYQRKADERKAEEDQARNIVALKVSSIDC